MPDLRDELVSALAGRYDVARELGHGGMAYVFLARDLKHDRQVAIKVLKPELATSISAERFLREIRITARLEHPNILRLYASDSVGSSLFYYVVQYVPGETLREKLDRETQLPIDEAIEIARQVAVALDYAHAHGVIHRDIKPANILLHGDQVIVADFGLARMYDSTDTTPLTQSAMVMGTPAYMSPEQVAGDTELDGRTDIYSLACVFFEMVAGSPPFRATTRQGLYGQHMTATPPSLCVERSNCPPEIDTAVQRALAKVPADRFRTAADFVRALEGEVVSTPGQRRTSGGRRPASPQSRRWTRVVGAAVAVTAAIFAAVVGLRGSDSTAAPLDASGYAVIPFSARGPGSDTTTITEGISQALAEWDGVRVIDGRTVRDVLDDRRGAPLRLTDATRVARDVGAGRLVWGDGLRVGDSVVVHASIYDPDKGEPIRTASISYEIGSRVSQQRFRELASTLLRSRSESPWVGASPRPKQSLAAWQSYDEGRIAAARWDIASAEQRFRDALRIDPDFAQAHLWFARVQIWSFRPADSWRASAKRALELRGALDEQDALGADAQVALAEGRYPDACDRYGRIVGLDTADFAGWFGLGECRLRDSAVVKDRRSPSGYRFRSSWQRALESYLHVVREMPAPHGDFVYARLGNLLMTEANKLRLGRGLDERNVGFAAYVARQSDTLAFVPYPLARLGVSVMPHSLPDAVGHNRAILRGIYENWTADAPRSVDAHVALATLLETTGELTGETPASESALRQIRMARGIASDDARQLKLAQTEIRLLVKSGDWRVAAALVDSIFRAVPRPTGEMASALAGAAALTGRLRTTTEIFLTDAPGFEIAMPNGDPLEIAPGLQRDVAQLRAFATLGVCNDSMRTFPTRVERALENYYNEPARRSVAHDMLMRRPLSLGAPCLGVTPLLSVSGGGDRDVMMQQALARGEHATVRAHFDTLRVVRAAGRPGDVAMDYTFLEGWLRTQLGDTAGAMRQLDRSLDALPTLSTYLLDQPSQSAGLVRAMMLRAELANAVNDRPRARQWAVAVMAVWANADPELQPDVRRMATIALRSH